MSYKQRVEAEFTGNASGFMAAVNQVQSGITRVGSGFRGGTRDGSLFANQLKAIGTTARYYLAGQLVFGVTSAISSLADFKGQLGEIDSLAGKITGNGNFQGLGDQLATVGSSAILTANSVGIATGDVEQYMTRFFSSFDPPGGAKQKIKVMNQFVTEMARLQAMMGSEAGDPQALAGGVAGFINSIPGGRKNIGANTHRVANLIAFLTKETPNITGQNVATDVGRIGAGMQLANMTPEQVFALWGVAAKAGGSPSVIGRGIAQLVGTSLMHPKSPAQLQAFQMAGLPTDPTQLRAMGGMNVVFKLLQSATTGKVRFSKSALNDPDADPATAIEGAGVSGINLTQLYNMFGRQESVRQFVNILGQGGVKAIKDYMAAQEKAKKQNLAWQREDAAIRQRTLLRFGVARNTFGISAMNGMSWPLEHMIADPTIAVSNFAARHTTATQAAVGGAFGLAATRSVNRLLGGRMFRGAGRFGKFLGAAGAIQQEALSSAISKEELPAAISGGKTDGSRGNPYWVIISPLSWAVGSPGGFMSPTGKTGVTEDIKKYGGWGAALFARYGSKAVSGLKGAGSAMELFGAQAPAIPDMIAILQGKDPFSDPRTKGMKNLAHFWKNSGTPLENSIVDRVSKNKLTPQAAERRLAALASIGDRARGVQHIAVTGEANGTFLVKMVDDHGNVIATVKEKGVPVKLWGAKQFPSSGGKPGVHKGSKK